MSTRVTPIRLAWRAALIATTAVGTSCAAAVALPQAAVAAASAPAAAVTYTNLKLINGWQNAAYGSAKAAVANISGIITFKGGIWTNGSSPRPFILPKQFRPAHVVFVPVDECEGNFGEMAFWPSGEVQTIPEGPFSNASCFTSLDGVSFAKSAVFFTPLTPLNGWVKSGRAPAARVISGIVHLMGGIKTSSGTSDKPFVLPKAFRPAADVFVPVDMCTAAKGRLDIYPSGEVVLETEQSFSSATCFTSLDGASFAKSAASFTPLTLQNGWHSYGLGFSGPAVRIISGVVRFKGAITTSGSNPVLFTLPKAFRPAHNVWTSVDLCDANNGRLHIQSNGVVTVQEEGGTFAHAACFTSLDGAWFAR